MHAAAVDPEDRFRHERGMQPVLHGQSFHRQLEGHNVVCGSQRVGIFEINFVLAGRDLVMAGFDFESHLLQAHADFTPGALTVIQRSKIEVSRFVAGAGGRMSLIIRLEEEKFHLRPHVERVSHVRRLLQHLLQHAPGITGKGSAVRVMDVADQPGDLSVLGPPRKNGESVQIGPQVLVALVDPHKSLDGTAVNHNLVVHCLLNLAGSDGHVFQLAENIRKLHADELYIAFPDHPDNVFLAVPAHNPNLLVDNKKGEGTGLTGSFALHASILHPAESHVNREMGSVAVFLLFSQRHSTVTLLARLRGLSTSSPRLTLV